MFVMQKDLAKIIMEKWVNPEVEHLKERKYLEQISVTLLITTKESVVNLRRRNGEMDLMGFFGTDEKFHKWSRDFFMLRIIVSDGCQTILGFH